MKDSCTPAKFDDLGYRPVYGVVELRGYRCEWSVQVSVSQGRAMEEDGIPVFWVHSSVPELVATLGLTSVWVALYRLWSWPSRYGGRT